MALQVPEVLRLCQAVARPALLLSERHATLLQARLRPVSRLSIDTFCIFQITRSSYFVKLHDDRARSISCARQRKERKRERAKDKEKSRESKERERDGGEGERERERERKENSLFFCSHYRMNK